MNHCHSTTAADFHAEQMGQDAYAEEMREMAIKNAVVTLFSNKKGVLVAPGHYVNASNVYEVTASSQEESEALRQMCNGDSRPARELYSEAAYNMLYPYADFLISNNSQPF